MTGVGRRGLLLGAIAVAPPVAVLALRVARLGLIAEKRAAHIDRI